MLRIFSSKWGVALALFLIFAIAISTKVEFFATNTAVGQATDDDFAYLERANRAFIEVINAAKPAVVQITTRRLVSGRSSQRQFDFFDEDLFRYWFGEPRNRRNQIDPEAEREIQEGLGSGVIVSEGGYVLTNNHVIDGAEEITVMLQNGREYEAEVVGKDPGNQGTDIAVLKIAGKDLPALEFGNSDSLKVGEWVVAIGSPFGYAQSVTRGIVSAKGRSWRTPNRASKIAYADFIQTDAAINRGNSGGALINIHGQLVGINTAIVTTSGLSPGNVGVGLAIPINLANHVMRSLIEKGEVERGWLGVGLQEINHDIAEELGIGEPRGALVANVGVGMPGDDAGLRKGDVIVEFDNVQIRNGKHLRDTVATTEVGKTVEVQVIRQGKERTLRVQLGKRTEDAIAAMDGSSRYVPGGLDEEAFAGLRVSELTDELAAAYRHKGEKGVIVVNVERRSPAAKAGIRKGDLIQEIDWEEVVTVADYRTHVKAVTDKPKIVMHVRHSNGTHEFIVLKNIASRQ